MIGDIEIQLSSSDSRVAGHFAHAMACMTAAEVASALGRRAVVLLPLGSQESHGPGLPMGDFLAAEAIGRAVADRVGAAGVECLVAPGLAFGAADYFGSVPGGMALGQGTFRAVLGDLLECLLRHGADRVVVLNGHGGNCQAIHEVTLGVRRRTGTIIPSLYLWRMARSLMGGAAARFGHGADPMASVAMHLHGLEALPARAVPAPVTVLGMEVRDFAQGMFQDVGVDLPLELDEIAPDGVAPGADPTLANRADGAALTERLVGLCADFTIHFAGQG